MKRLSVNELKAGMKFDKPVYVDEENILVPPGIPIKNKDIERLKKWGIVHVETDGTVVRHDDLSDSEKLPFGKLLGAEEDTAFLNSYIQAIEDLAAVYKAVSDGQKINAADVEKVTDDFYPSILENSYEMISFTIRNERTRYKSAQSSINCMILSAVTGLNLKMPSHRLMQLATGAMLHDIGMMKIPKNILDKQGALSEQEIQALQTHPLYSYTIITKELRFPEEIGLIALQHHERWDGKGYPRQLSGKGIALPARIVSVADAFEAMVQDRPYRNSMIGYTAMRQILNDNSRRFDPQVLKIFIQSMGIYPIGSIVVLNNGSIGRVIKIHSSAPLRPGLLLLINENGVKMREEHHIDLLKEKNLFIAKAIHPKEISS